MSATRRSPRMINMFSSFSSVEATLKFAERRVGIWFMEWDCY
jgi:hypothetical protein